jgi:hypothetical protein
MGAPLAVTETIAASADEALAADAARHIAALLAAGESVLEEWLRAHGRQPTQRRVEGFRLLALHRQAAGGEPSFNACRESCRELVFQCNMAAAEDNAAGRARRLRLAAMVATHLALFVAGKLEDAGLGEFCCSSRDLRRRGDAADATNAALQES